MRVLAAIENSHKKVIPDRKKSENALNFISLESLRSKESLPNNPLRTDFDPNWDFFTRLERNRTAPQYRNLEILTVWN